MKGFAKGLNPANTEVFKAIGEDFSEFMDSDASGCGTARRSWTRGKILGWVLGVAAIVGAVLFVIGLFTGVSEALVAIAGPLRPSQRWSVSSSGRLASWGRSCESGPPRRPKPRRTSITTWRLPRGNASALL